MFVVDDSFVSFGFTLWSGGELDRLMVIVIKMAGRSIVGSDGMLRDCVLLLNDDFPHSDFW